MQVVPETALAPLRAGLWQPLMWAYCEGIPIGIVVLFAVPGPLLVRTTSSTLVGIGVFILGWLACRAIAKRDPKAIRVYRRSLRYRNGRTATLPARATWGSPAVRFRERVH